MPLIGVVWFLFSLLSLAVWGGAGYLLWSWFDGQAAMTIDGSLVREREDWRLWAGLALLAWSLLGRFIVTPLIAKPDKHSRQFVRKAGRMIESDQGALYIEERGDMDAPAILLTHGQGLDATLWTDLADELAKRFRVISWDLPGLGKSKHARGFHPAGAARALRFVLQQVKAEHALLVGHSFGGMTLQEFAQLDPTLMRSSVSGIVLLNTTYTNPVHTTVASGFFSAIQEPVLEPGSHLTVWLQPFAWLNLWQSYLSGWAHLANRIQFSKDVTRSLLEHTTLVAVRNPPASIERRNLGMYHWRGLEQADFGVPVLIIAGGRDIVTKREAGEEIARRVKGAKLQIIERANHMGPFEQVEAYGSAISSFAGTLDAQPVAAAAEAPQALSDADQPA
jgi:pimeloyl-ACP methyl ester carboxylesterase